MALDIGSSLYEPPRACLRSIKLILFGGQAIAEIDYCGLMISYKDDLLLNCPQGSCEKVLRARHASKLTGQIHQTQKH